MMAGRDGEWGHMQQRGEGWGREDGGVMRMEAEGGLNPGRMQHEWTEEWSRAEGGKKERSLAQRSHQKERRKEERGDGRKKTSGERVGEEKGKGRREDQRGWEREARQQH